MILSGAVHLQDTRTLSIFFEENRGQARSNTRFVARGAGYSLAFTPQGTDVALSHSGKRLSFTTTLAGSEFKSNNNWRRGASWKSELFPR